MPPVKTMAANGFLGKNMIEFLFSIVLFIIVLAFFWGVLFWVRFRKRDNGCACGKGACLTKAGLAKEKELCPDQEQGACNASDCRCDE